MKNKKDLNWTTLILVILLVAASFLAGKYIEKSKKNPGEAQNKNVLSVNASPTPIPTTEPLATTIGHFSVTKDEVCKKDEKPVIYFFGGSFCPHCQWNHPIVQKVAKEFADQVIFRDNMDKLNDLSGDDKEVYDKYQAIHGGAVPFLVFGCKYLRLGSGEDMQAKDGGKAAEEKNLTALLCKLTDNQPEKICASVKDLVEQVK